MLFSRTVHADLVEKVYKEKRNKLQEAMNIIASLGEEELNDALDYIADKRELN